MITINFKPSIKQFEAWGYLSDKETHFIGYGGAAYSGKSYLLCYWLTINCIAYPGTAWGLARKSLTTLKKTTMLTLFKVFGECGITTDVYKYNQQLNYIEFTNGSVIFLIDTAYQPSDPLYTRFGGFELTGCAIDESAETDMSAIEVLSTRIGRKDNGKYGITAKILETFNPAKNHVYKKYYKPYRDGNMMPGYVFVPALPKDNPSPDVQAYIERIIQSANKVTIERLIYGNFEYDDDPATLIDNDSIIDYFNPQHLSADVRDLKYMTIDVARKGKDKTVFRIWNGWLCIHRSELAISLTTEVVNKAKDLQRSFGVPLTNIIADEDGVGGGVVDGLKCKGFINNSSPIDVLDGTNKIKPNFDNLKAQCSINMAKKICLRESGEICGDPHVIKVVSEEMEQVKIKDIDKDGKQGIVPKERIKELIGRSPDDWDSIMMRYWFELSSQRGYMFDNLNIVDALPINRENILRLSFTDVSDTGEDYFCTWFMEINDGKIYIFDGIYNNESSKDSIDNYKLKAVKNMSYLNRIQTKKQGSVYISVLRGLGVSVTGYTEQGNRDELIKAYCMFGNKLYFVSPMSSDNEDFKSAFEHIQSFPKQGNSYDGLNAAEFALTELIRYIYTNYRYLLLS